jgi:hypothetical protein
MSEKGRKPKFKIRLDGGLTITVGRPLGADLSRGATGLRRWRQERGRTAARDAPEVDLLHCRYPLMHPQFSCHPMGHTTPIPGRCTRKRITDPAPVGMVSEVAARDKRQPGGPECRRNPVVSYRSETVAVHACADGKRSPHAHWPRVHQPRVRRELQPAGEISLQTGCRFSDERSTTQFMIVTSGGQRPVSRVSA